MATISKTSIPKSRKGGDITFKIRLKDGGVSVAWTSLTNIRVFLYSDAQRVLAGELVNIDIDQEDETLLTAVYGADSPQYLGMNSIVVRAAYDGKNKTYDKKAIYIVGMTEELFGEEIVITDPIVDVTIDVEDVSTTIMETLIAACVDATERANEAAASAEHMVDIKTGPQGPQGNSGSSVDYPFELVDNLHTDDGEKALSARQGKILQDGKVGKEELADGADYEKEDIDLANIAVQSLAINLSGVFASNGSHCTLYLEPGDIIKITGNASNSGKAAFLSKNRAPKSGYNIGRIVDYEIAAGKTYYLQAPSGTVAFIFNTVEGASTDVAPASLSIYRAVSRDVDNEIDGNAYRDIDAEMWAASNDALVWADGTKNKNKLIRVKAGHRYAAFPTSNGTVEVYFMTEFPRIGLSVTTLSTKINSNTYYEGSSLLLSPSSNGYYMFRCYNSSSATLTVTYTEMSVSEALQDKVNKLGVRSDFTFDNTVAFRRVNFDALTWRDGYIDSRNGRWQSASGTTGYKHALVPVSAGQILKIKKGVSSSVVLAWFTSNAPVERDAVPPYVQGTTRFTVTDTLLTVPEGANYLFVFFSNSPYNSTPGYLGIATVYDSMPDIVRDNDYLKTKRILAQFIGRTEYELDNAHPNKPLVLIHYSDLHGIAKNQDRINDYRTFWADYIDATIHTGDILADKWADDFIFSESEKDILNVIGNHDTATGTGTNRDWYAKQGLESYNRYFAPFVSNWGVTQPSDAATNGYCYYYKDFADNHVRLIVIDSWDNDTTYQTTEQAWFADVLAGAKTAGYSVIVASHFRIKAESLLECPFTKPDAAVTSPDSSRIKYSPTASRWMRYRPASAAVMTRTGLPWLLWVT